MGGWWRWALVSPDGVAPSQMVSVSASVNLPLHHKVQKFSSGTGSPGWSWKKGRKTVVVWCGVVTVVWWLDLAFLCLYCVLQFICVRFSFFGIILCYSLFVYMCYCSVRFGFFSTMPRDWLGRTSEK